MRCLSESGALIANFCKRLVDNHWYNEIINISKNLKTLPPCCSIYLCLPRIFLQLLCIFCFSDPTGEAGHAPPTDDEDPERNNANNRTYLNTVCSVYKEWLFHVIVLWQIILIYFQSINTERRVWKNIIFLFDVSKMWNFRSLVYSKTFSLHWFLP